MGFKHIKWNEVREGDVVWVRDLNLGFPASGPYTVKSTQNRVLANRCGDTFRHYPEELQIAQNDAEPEKTFTTNKTPGMASFLQAVVKAQFGTELNDVSCSVCGSKDVGPETFRDPISKREFEISRMCQKCQDKIFKN